MRAVLECRGGGVTHHSILSYQERLYGYLEQLALQRSTSTAANLPGGQRAASRGEEDPASLFRQAPSHGAGDNPLLDEVGRFAGRHYSLVPGLFWYYAQQLERCTRPSLWGLQMAVCTKQQVPGQATALAVGMLLDSRFIMLKYG